MNDIVYFVKETFRDEELTYSLRSVEKNFPHRKVWFAGGCPNDLKPDGHLQIVQNLTTKWANVFKMIREVCENDEVTEDFWLFNDDFFMLQPIKKVPPMYDGTLQDQIKFIEEVRDGGCTDYTKKLREDIVELEKRGLETLNYDVHVPMLINRKKALEVFKEFPTCPMFRSLYGNYHKIGGYDITDVKIWNLWEEVPDFIKIFGMLSSSDASWSQGTVGKYVKAQFLERSRFEK